MDYKLAIETIRMNFPPAQHTQLVGALETAIQVLEEKAKEEESKVVIDVETFYELEKEYSNN